MASRGKRRTVEAQSVSRRRVKHQAGKRVETTGFGGDGEKEIKAQGKKLTIWPGCEKSEELYHLIDGRNMLKGLAHPKGLPKHGLT